MNIKKNQYFQFYSVAFDLTLLKLADKDEMHNILNVFEFLPDRTTYSRVSQNNTPIAL